MSAPALAMAGALVQTGNSRMNIGLAFLDLKGHQIIGVLMILIIDC